MQRILHCVLAALVGLTPMQALASSKYDADGESSSTAKKKKKTKKVKRPVAEKEQEEEAAANQGDEEESQGTRHKRKRPKVIEVAPEGTDAPKEEKEETAEPEKTVAKTPAAQDDDDDDFEDNPSKWVEVLTARVPPRRYAYVVGVVLAGTGLVFAYQAQGEAKRAETITSALEAQRAVQSARASASLANVLYGVAGAAVLLALILEFLPEPVAERANLTFHF